MVNWWIGLQKVDGLKRLRVVVEFHVAVIDYDAEINGWGESSVADQVLR
jgi:hypothetical protein